MAELVEHIVAHGEREPSPAQLGDLRTVDDLILVPWARDRTALACRSYVRFAEPFTPALPGAVSSAWAKRRFVSPSASRSTDGCGRAYWGAATFPPTAISWLLPE